MRWVVNAMPQPLYPSERDPVPIVTYSPWKAVILLTAIMAWVDFLDGIQYFNFGDKTLFSTS
jgi:hypothetical protein